MFVQREQIKQIEFNKTIVGKDTLVFVSTISNSIVTRELRSNGRNGRLKKVTMVLRRYDIIFETLI